MSLIADNPPSAKAMRMLEEDLHFPSMQHARTVPGWITAVTKHDARLLYVHYKTILDEQDEINRDADKINSLKKEFVHEKTKSSKLQNELDKVRSKCVESELEVVRCKRSFSDLNSKYDEVQKDYKRLREQPKTYAFQECPVCYIKMNVPVASVACGHVICRACWANTAVCPFCKVHRDQLIKIYLN